MLHSKDEVKALNFFETIKKAKQRRIQIGHHREGGKLLFKSSGSCTLAYTRRQELLICPEHTKITHWLEVANSIELRKAIR